MVHRSEIAVSVRVMSCVEEGKPRGQSGGQVRETAQAELLHISQRKRPVEIEVKPIAREAVKVDRYWTRGSRQSYSL